MCHFPGFPPRTLCVQVRVTRHYPCRVPPFGDPCFIARLRLHTAYRSLPRPSSAFGAKASTIRPYYLNGMDSRYAVFKDQTPTLSRALKRSGKVLPPLKLRSRAWKALKTEQQLLESEEINPSPKTGRSILERSTEAASWQNLPLEPLIVAGVRSVEHYCSTCSLERR
jgi:hypothetical protein